MNTKIVEARDLTKRYQGFTLQSLNLVIEPGEVVGLVGTNGAGKTTLIKCILGLTKIDEGTLELFGQSAPAGATAAMREQIGVVLDTNHIPRAFNLRDVEMLMAASYLNWDAQAFRGYLDKLHVDEFKKIEQLSRGNSMKLAIACALAHSPRLLLLDEATAGLDPMVRDEVLDVIRNYQMETECGVLMCSHITSDLEKVADRIVCLDAGRTAFASDREAITDRAGLARCRQVDLDALLEQGFANEQPIRLERNAYGINVLVEDRFSFAARYPEIPCDRCTIEDYMRINLKGEKR